MNTDAVATQVYNFLTGMHSRVVQNKPINQPAFPYIVFKIEAIDDDGPEDLMQLVIEINEDPTKTAEMIQALADQIDGDGYPFGPDGVKPPTGLDERLIDTEDVNLYFTKRGRQYTEPNEVVGMHTIQLRYFIQVLYK